MVVVAAVDEVDVPVGSVTPGAGVVPYAAASHIFCSSSVLGVVGGAAVVVVVVNSVLVQVGFTSSY